MLSEYSDSLSTSAKSSLISSAHPTNTRVQSGDGTSQLQDQINAALRTFDSGHFPLWRAN
jgi:hypothetical protein